MKKFRVFWKKHKTNIIFLLVGTIIIIGMYIWGIWIFPKLVSSVSVRGRWGDSFGVVTALFTGLAFVILIWTLHVQKDELRLQRGEIRGQKEQLQAQNQTLQKQNFESSFFQLLDFHNANFNVMTLQGAEKDDHIGVEKERLEHEGLKRARELLKANFGDESMEIKYRVYQNGHDCFSYFLKGLQNIHNEYPDCHKRSKKQEEFLAKGGHYFRYLYSVVKFVDQQEFFGEEENKKKFYTELICTQLSRNEFGVLFYYGLTGRGAEFKVLIEKYALFEDMPLDVLIEEEHKDLYAPSAYGESE